MTTHGRGGVQRNEGHEPGPRRRRQAANQARHRANRHSHDGNEHEDVNTEDGREDRRDRRHSEEQQDGDHGQNQNNEEGEGIQNEDQNQTPRSRNRNRNRNRNRQQQNQNQNQQRVKFHYDEWLSREEIEAGVSDGSIFTGTMRINAKNRREAFVNCPELVCDIYIPSEVARNRALNGDVVAVRLTAEDEWHERKEAAAKLSSGVAKMVDAFAKLEMADDDEGLWQPLVQKNHPAAKQKIHVEDDASSDDDDDEVADGETDTAKKTKKKLSKAAKARIKAINEGHLQPRGIVVGVLAANEGAGVNEERSHAQVHIGVLVPQYGFERERPSKVVKGKPLAAEEAFVEFRPLDARVPFFLIPRGEVPYEFVQDPVSFAPPHQKLFEATIANWEAEHRFPKGRLLRMVGEAGEIGPETEALLIETNCDHGEFPEAALDVLREKIPEEGGFRIPEDEIKRRRDLRTSHRIFTIDPATAKDLDDALSCVPIPAGAVSGTNGPLPAHYEIGVHIADVSYFLEPDTALDREAQRRSTTVYLVNKVIPMLPALLSEELCSLNEGVDRLAYSCIWRMTEDGQMLSGAPPPWFGRTVIRSCARLEYSLAQRMVDGVVTENSVDTGNPEDPECWPDRRAPAEPITKAQVIEDVRNLSRIAMSRRKMRFDKSKGGALGLEAIKLSFRRDDLGNPIGVKTYPLYDSNRTIEEYMLMANYLVAQRLILDMQKLAFIRHHPPPDPRGMVTLMQAMEQKGITFEPTAMASAAGLHETLQRLRYSESEELVEIVNYLLRKPMRHALYATAGSLEQRDWRHWALNIPYYTHFTSPIRRYADVMVHRQLTYILNDAIEDYPDTEEITQQIAEHCNEKKDASKQAQDASDRLFFCVFIKQRFASGNPIRTLGVVQELGPQSFTLLLTEFGVECRVHAEIEWGASKIIPTYKDDGSHPSPSGAAEQENGGHGRRGRGQGGNRRGSHQESNERNSGRRHHGRRGGNGDRGEDDGENDQEQNNKKKGKKDDKPKGDVVSLNLQLRSHNGGRNAPLEEITLELLTTVNVILEPTIKASARIDFLTRYIGLSSTEVTHHHKDASHAHATGKGHHDVKHDSRPQKSSRGSNRNNRNRRGGGGGRNASNGAAASEKNDRTDSAGSVQKNNSNNRNRNRNRHRNKAKPGNNTGNGNEE
mmetsp:Transcript_19664/g.34248  ORF Transcript_19664/g.34248 Transcript_19664/m.34248 type:complete len:1170 (-) Transcript_19664:203-3712(-)